MQEFGFAQQIETGKRSGFYQFKLVDDIYRQATSPALADLRMYDETGMPVPFRLQYSSADEETNRLVPVGFYPLMGNFEVGLEGFSVHIKRNEEQRIIAVDTESTKGSTIDGIVGYVIDLAVLQKPVDRLILTFKDAEEKKLRSFTVKASNHLSSWQTIASAIPIGEISQNGKKFILNTLPLGSRKFRQVHVSWDDRRDPIELVKVEALPDGAEGQAGRKWLFGKAVVSDQDKNVFYIDTGGHFPVDRMQIKPYPVDTALHISLSSRDSQTSGWKEAAQFEYYNLGQAGYRIRSLPAAFPAVRDRYWRMEVQGLDNSIADRAPQLALGWLPDHLYFRADAEEKYMLAYGNAAVNKGPDLPLKIKFDAEKKFNTAVSKDRVVLSGTAGGAGVNSENKAPAANDAGWLKWLIMISSIIILALLLFKVITNTSTQKVGK